MGEVDVLGLITKEIAANRVKTIHEFLKATLAARMPDGVDLKEFIKTLELVEDHRDGRVCWYVQERKSG